MKLDLGARLLRAGLVSLADLSTVGVGTDATVARRLVESGFPEDVLAGFFVAEGYGPPVSDADLQSHDPVPNTLSIDVMKARLALPVRKKATSWIVAMAVPDNESDVHEIEQKLGLRVEARVAFVTDLQGAIGGEAERASSKSGARRLSEPRIIESDSFREHTAADPTFDLVKRRTRASQVVPRKTKTPAAGISAVAMPAIPPPPRRIINTSPGIAPSPPIAPVAKKSNTKAPPPPPPQRKSKGKTERPDAWNDVTVQASTHQLVDLAQTHVRSESIKPPPRALASLRSFEALLGAMRSIDDEQEILRIACRAAAAVARSVVYFEVRAQHLAGRAVEGNGVTEERIRRVALPTDAGSVFRRPWALGERYRGACGSSAADAIYLSAVDGIGAHVHVEPVFLESRVVGLLALDEVDKSPLSDARVEAVAVTLSESLERLLKANKR